jgi:haloalkane dehalogenase
MNLYRLPGLDAGIAYHDLGGPGPVCVYLHGLGSASSADYPAIAGHQLLAPYRSILIDFLGFGFSDRAESFSHTLEAHGETVMRLLDHLGIEKFHLIGHSWGGSIAIVMAADHQTRLLSLTVAEPNLQPEDAGLSGTIAAQSEAEYITSGQQKVIEDARSRVLPGTDGGSYVRTLRAADPRSMHRAATHLVAAELEEKFYSLNTPRHYVYGSQTLPDPYEPRLAEHRIPTSIVADAGHSMMVNNPEGFVLALTAFWSSLNQS